MTSPSIRWAGRKPLLVCIGAALSVACITPLLPLGFAIAVSIGVLATLGAFLIFRRQGEAAERNLTDALALAAELERINRDLREFAFSVSHDLRAPLVTTKGLVHMAKEAAQDGETSSAMALLDRAESATRRMDVLIEGFLAQASPGGVPCDDLVSVDDIVTTTLADLGPALEDARFHVEVDPVLGTVLGERCYVQQVFDNLIGNALRYGQPEPKFGPGRVLPRLHISAVHTSDTLRVTVADNGPGVPLDKQPRLFSDLRSHRPGEAPRTASTATGAGRGLGLPLIARAMSACGGEISYAASPLGGASFVLEFRAAPCTLPIRPATDPARISFSSKMIKTTA